MSGSKVHHLSTLLTAAQHCKHLLHFPTILLVLWLICCCHHHQCNAIKLFPVHEHDPANSFSKFVSYDGNLPAKVSLPCGLTYTNFLIYDSTISMTDLLTYKQMLLFLPFFAISFSLQPNNLTEKTTTLQMP